MPTMNRGRRGTEDVRLVRTALVGRAEPPFFLRLGNGGRCDAMGEDFVTTRELEQQATLYEFLRRRTTGNLGLSMPRPVL